MRGYHRRYCLSGVGGVACVHGDVYGRPWLSVLSVWCWWCCQCICTCIYVYLRREDLWEAITVSGVCLGLLVVPVCMGVCMGGHGCQCPFVMSLPASLSINCGIKIYHSIIFLA